MSGWLSLRSLSVFWALWDLTASTVNGVLLTDLCSVMNPEHGPEYPEPSLGPSSALTPGPVDCPLLGVAKTPGGECHFNKSPTDSDDFDISITNLPEKLGFTPEFLAELDKVGGDSLPLCHKLLVSHTSEGSDFRAGQL